MGQTDVQHRQIEFVYLCLPVAAGKARLGHAGLYSERRERQKEKGEIQNMHHGILFSVRRRVQYVKVFLNDFFQCSFWVSVIFNVFSRSKPS